MDLSVHPCFNDVARNQYARVHLPVAPFCNLQCNFCDRRFDCVNETRPGVSSALLRPEDAARYVDDVAAAFPSLRVVGIAGPGEPLAHAATTFETLRLVGTRHPDLLLCVATNGLALVDHAETLAKLRVSHVTVTMCAVDPAIAALIYAWVLDGGCTLVGEEAGRRLLDAQRSGIRALVRNGIRVKVNSVVVPGVNDSHIEDVAKEAARLGAVRFNCLPLLPVAGTPFANCGEPSQDDIRSLRARCASHLPQMESCARCRADAVGYIGRDASIRPLAQLRNCANAAGCGGRR